MLLQSHLFSIIQQFSRKEMETPNNFWPFRFLKGVHICVFDKNRNLNTFSVQIWTGQVFRFQFSTKTQMWTPLRKSRRLDLRFEKKWKCEHVFLYDLFRFVIWNKMKIRTPFRNLNSQKLLGVSTSGTYHK